VSSDCTTNNPCILSRCKEGKCVNTLKTGCCGNTKCETSAGENKCTCPTDCGECIGKVKYNVSTYRGPKEVETEYAMYLCENKQCVIRVNPSVVKTPSFTSDVSIRGGFDAEIVTTLNQPFDTSRDKISIRFKLKDIDKDIIDGITFSSIQVLSGNELIGEKIINNKLSSVGDVFVEDITISPAQSAVEAERNLEFNFDYEYAALERGEEVTYRSTIKNRLSKMVLVVP